MTTAIIALVVSLLAAVQQPNVSVQYQIQALTLAEQLITLAESLPASNSASAATSTPDIIDASSTPAVSTSTPATVNVVVNVPAEPAQIQVTEAPVAAAPQAPAEPVCVLNAELTNVGNVLFTWQMDPNASGSLSGYGTLPIYSSSIPTPNASGHLSSTFVQIFHPASTSTVYTLTEDSNEQTVQCTAVALPQI